MTSKLTREEMLARAKESVKALRMASRQHAFESARSEILADLQIAEFALSCLESEPVAWSDEQCMEFLSIAFRHARIIGDLKMDDIRDGIRIVNDGRAAMIAAAPQEVTTGRPIKK